MLKKLKALLLIPLILLSAGGCAPRSESISRSGNYFDTVITITLYRPDQEKYLDGCFKLAQKYENYFSTTIADSDISKINSANGSPVRVHEETADIIKKSIEYSRLTDGCFDISVGALSSLWQDAIKEKKVPDDSVIKEAVKTIDYTKIKIDHNMVSTAPGQKLDLGGIAKGYIADKMKLYLEKNHVKSALINLGGNVLTLGKKPDGSKYLIGIKKPFTENGEIIDTLSVSNRSVVTSGTYERYFKYDGRIYHHILDLKTGYPVQNDLDSVTIISDKSTDGDALSTSLFLLGEKKARKLIKNLDNVDAIFVHKDLSESKTFKD